MKKSGMARIVIMLALIVGVLSINTTSIQATSYTCHQDSECVIASKPSVLEKCCNDCGSEVIHKKEEADRIQWRNSHCSKSEMNCPIFDCSSPQNTEPACVKNRCVEVVPKSFKECRNNLRCLLKFASETGDINICKKVRETLGGCSKNIWDGEVRKYVPSYNEYFDCLISLAQKNKDRSICDSINTIITKDCSTTFHEKELLSFKVLCLSGAAKDINDCHQIPGDASDSTTIHSLKWTCYDSFAKSGKDCLHIQNVYLRNKCIGNHASLRECAMASSEKTGNDQNDYRSWCITRNEGNKSPPISLRDCNLPSELKTAKLERVWENCVDAAIKKAKSDSNYQVSCTLLEGAAAIHYCFEKMLLNGLPLKL